MGMCECVAGEEETVSAMEFELTRGLDIDFHRMGENAARLAVDSTGGEHGPSGVMDVLLAPMAFEDIFEGVLQTALDGDAVFGGRSAWAEMIGETVAPDWVSIVDDALMPGGMGTAPCDDEGMPSRNNVLVRDGLLQGFLHTRESAKKMSTVSTGNAIRDSYRQLPRVEIRNLRLECRREPPLEGCEHGLLVHDLVGAHTINHYSGDFSIQASNAFIVRRGEVESPVSGVMLSGNVFDALKNIVAVSEEEKCMGNVMAPWVRVEGMNVVGMG
jgi:PmbA protein